MKKILIVITALLMAANAGNTQSLSKFLKGANKVLETLNEMTEEPQKTPQQEKKLLLSAKSSYIIIMIGPSSDFGSQPYFGYL